jgi:hypothetical protein
MATQFPSPPSKLESGATVSHLHHVGHVVHNIESAITLYRRMGFVVPPPSYPALALHPGEPARAFGAGNTHVSLGNSFVELVTVIDDQQGGGVDADTTLVPLQAPPEVLRTTNGRHHANHEAHFPSPGSLRGTAHSGVRYR